MPFLNKTGLGYFWSKIVAKFVAKEDGKGLSSNDFTDSDKNKLDSLTDDHINELIDAKLSELDANKVAY